MTVEQADGSVPLAVNTVRTRNQLTMDEARSLEAVRELLNKVLAPVTPLWPYSAYSELVQTQRRLIYLRMSQIEDRIKQTAHSSDEFLSMRHSLRAEIDELFEIVDC
jgi:hypothetical protein